MTTLVVTPIRLGEVGSYRERRKFLRVLQRLQDLKETKDAGQVLAILDEADELVRGRLRTDDGTPVEDVLDRLSANEFDQLLSAIAFEGGVGEASAVPSTDGTAATPLLTT